MSETDREWIDDFVSAFTKSLSSFLPATVDVDAQRSQLPIHPLRTVQKLDPEELLSVLNFKDEESKVGLLARMNRISVRLRRCIDEWLDSGRTADGVECPTSRNYENAKTVCEAVHKYSTRGKMHLRSTRDRIELWFDLQDGKTPLASEGFPLSIYIETVASEKLVLFLLSDLSYKIARCREAECGRYFILKQWNRTYKTGTRCDECQRARSLKSAVAATADERDRAEKKLHELAATRFGEQIRGDSSWHKNPKLKDRIAHSLSRKIEHSADLQKVYPAGVTGKWVARADNWTAIETAARKGRSHHVSVSL